VTHKFPLEKALEAFELQTDPTKLSIKIHIVDETDPIMAWKGVVGYLGHHSMELILTTSPEHETAICITIHICIRLWFPAHGRAEITITAISIRFYLGVSENG
jgi:hypothetical protein